MSGRPTVVIPTFCEAGSVVSIIDRVRNHAPNADVLIVDDGSPDGTGELVARRAERDDHVALLQRGRKQGLGTAYRDAYLRLTAAGVPVVVQMDADGSHPPERIPHLIEALERADVAIGSRWVPGGAVVNWPRRREILSRAANRYARLALRTGVRDVTAGFRAYRTSALTALGIADVRSEGYAFQIEMTRRALGAGLAIVELPITFVERETGASKMSRRVIIEALVRTTIWALGSPSR